MPPALGPAPIVDFDGTIVRLPVDWTDLRRRLGVGHISDLWALGRSDAFCLVTEMEVAAAGVGGPISAVMDSLALTTSFAVLTSNSALAVRRFFSRFPEHERRLACVIGREELGGPKTDFACFRAGVGRCLDATKTALGEAPAVYLGDSAYELAFAATLGIAALDVADLICGAGTASG